MKKKILDRYSRTRDNQVIIDINAGRVEEIYDDFDKHAPYMKKELDQELVDYLIDSASEIGREDFVIQFRFAALPDAKLMSRVKTSVRNYFHYLIELEFRELARMSRSSVILLGVGVVILSLSVWITNRVAGHETVVTNVFAEGLNVAAWVSLWNAIANVLINWMPHRRQIKMYERLAKAKIIFRETPP